MTTTEKIALLENRKNVLLERDKDNTSIIRKIDRNLKKLRNNAWQEEKSMISYNYDIWKTYIIILEDSSVG